MRISVLGAGYVGLVTGLCLCEMGHSVVCVDVVNEKVKALNDGRSPLFEEGIEGLLVKHLEDGRFRATLDHMEMKETEITFICVGTPSKPDGSQDTTPVEDAAESLGRVIGEKDEFHIAVVKSTMVPTFTEKIVLPALVRGSGKEAFRDFGVAVNPEFLREGMAVRDFMQPDRVIIGCFDQRSGEALRSIYAGIGCPLVEVSPSTAEMIKLASNCFLATKISFINEIGNVCKAMGIDVREVARGMGHDPRIGDRFLQAGSGFGGSCFPKDLRSLATEMERMGVEPRMLRATLAVNEEQPLRLIHLLERHMDLKDRKVAVLGLAFKPGTDDVRESRSITLLKALRERGAKVLAHDPKAIGNFKKLFPSIDYYEDLKECIRECDALIIVTEWPEYADTSLYGDKLVIDGRGVVKTRDYEGICW